MYDLEIIMENRPGQLALMGETLGAAGISVEGGGMFLVDERGVAHFLVEDGPTAQHALESVGLNVAARREVLVQRLKQEEPGQLGTLCRAMANVGVNIEVLYSDHDHQLILLVDDPTKGRAVSDAWTRQQAVP
jgi:hypothetical protein